MYRYLSVDFDFLLPSARLPLSAEPAIFDGHLHVSVTRRRHTDVAMEKYSQFRDKGTAIAPFLPVPPAPASFLWTPVSLFLFFIRVPFLLLFSAVYFLLLEWAPLGQTVKYATLWMMLSIPGVWWVDLQVDGVRRGQLHTSGDHLPRAGSVIASCFTSPLDPLYLAGIFQPIFTRCYPHIRKVERITLFRAILVAFSAPRLSPPKDAKLYTLKELVEQNPTKIICVFPETTTTNGRGILPLSPCLLSTDGTTKIYPVNLRYTPGDITTPVPGSYATWIWRILHKPHHQMRARIATKIFNSHAIDIPNKLSKTGIASGYDTNIFDQPAFKENEANDGWGDMKVDVPGGAEDLDISADEQKVLDRVGEDLARLGRVKRVGLGVQDKVDFLKVWGARRR
ncbi:hypothetical protein BDU57DRAFT_513831 [Ampelomyces quisqualis]|uniref:Phospholipid/glycerol acyltransferase domain-containing protein n=1 Tax=Ampelomyces quisqualis TaxID=50730 RepID=A0A6A5QQ56_AMPQU|nr:hypothetical protein BDU57DRAFT_513831 [Ampelomyces quisqualis]